MATELFLSSLHDNISRVRLVIRIAQISSERGQVPSESKRTRQIPDRVARKPIRLRSRIVWIVRLETRRKKDGSYFL